MLKEFFETKSWAMSPSCAHDLHIPITVVVTCKPEISVFLVTDFKQTRSALGVKMAFVGDVVSNVRFYVKFMLKNVLHLRFA